MKVLRIVSGWFGAVIVAVLVGSIIQTQFNLAAIAALGASIGLADRLATTAHDLVHFSPVYAFPVAVALAIAWPIAALASRRLPGGRRTWFALAGFSAVLVMIAVMNRALPITAIAATRELAGTLLLAAGGALAGWLYARLPQSA
ncbi:MAG: hypothetical protein RQ729_00030 [Wenzhouxiangellaceae bacterium]|nr:hypothetical protein [Wenzhouxiangellaceae bacterium]